MSIKIEKITEPLLLGESPHWVEEQQALFFVSVLEHSIHKYLPATRVHTRTKLDGPVGFMVPVEGTVDQFVVGLERRVVVVQWDGCEGSVAREVQKLGDVDQDTPTNKLNDGKADPRGRLFTGTMGSYESSTGQFQMEKGSFYRIDDRGIVKMCDRITLSNGLAWDVARRAMYYIDSLEYNIRRYDYDIDTGEMSNKTYIFDFKKNGHGGFGDGMTIDTDGNLWVAEFQGSCVIKLDPNTGKVLQTVELPTRQVTSVTFGGPNYDILFVTSASCPWMGNQSPSNGPIFMVTGLGVKGCPNVSFKLP